MPIVNTYYSTEAQAQELLGILDDLKQKVAELLTCGDIKLATNEITIRLVKTNVQGLIADIELELFAHAFKERVDKQDAICLELREYTLKAMPSIKDTRVWLVLSELGHSWESINSGSES